MPATHLAVYVVHNKLQAKKAQLPDGVPEFVAKVGSGAGSGAGGELFSQAMHLLMP